MDFHSLFAIPPKCISFHRFMIEVKAWIHPALVFKIITENERKAVKNNLKIIIDSWYMSTKYKAYGFQIVIIEIFVSSVIEM